MFRILLICLFISIGTRGQSDNHKYFIKFTDKNNSSFTVSNPSSFLSQRAINRRLAQNIPIEFNDLPVNGNYIDSVVIRGANVLTRSKWLNGITIECDSTVLANITTLPFVEYSKCVLRTSALEFPKELETSAPLNFTSTLRTTSIGYGQSFTQIHLMNGEFLHDEGFTGHDMLIALLDAGFFFVDQLPAFDSIRLNNKIVSTWDFVSNDPLVYDDDPHGMSVLSTIAGNIPGQLVGTAPHASFLLLRTEDASSESIIEEYNWAAGAEYADSAGADVISSSLGYTEFDDTTTNHVYADMDGDHCPSTIAADVAASKGMLVINSAGNQGVNPWHYISAPSDGDSVMSIGAVDSSGFHVYFSSWGPSADGDIKPNVAAMGFECTIADAWGGISTGSGTSFACPILAGAATCLWQSNASLTAMEIKDAIERSANYFNAPNDSLGNGIPDFRIATFILSAGKTNALSTDDILDVYPNPFSDNLNVSFYSVKNQSLNIEFLNTMGQIVKLEKVNASANHINTFTIHTGSNLKSGVYFIRVSTGNEAFVKRIIRY